MPTCFSELTYIHITTCNWIEHYFHRFKYTCHLRKNFQYLNVKVNHIPGIVSTYKERRNLKIFPIKNLGLCLKYTKKIWKGIIVLTNVKLNKEQRVLFFFFVFKTMLINNGYEIAFNFRLWNNSKDLSKMAVKMSKCVSLPLCVFTCH